MSEAGRNGLTPRPAPDKARRFSPKIVYRQVRGWLRLRVLDRPISRLRGPLRQLETEGHRVENTTRDLETRFLAIGADIEKMATLSGDLVSRSERLLALATGQSSGEDVLSTAIEELRRPVEFLENSRVRWAEIISRLREHLRLVGEIRRMEATLEQAVAPLRFIQTFFRIESATLPSEVQHVFSSLTQDIGELHHRVVDLFAEQFQSLRKAEQTVAALVKRLDVQLHHHETLVLEKKKLIEEAMANLKLMLDENRAVDIRLTGTTREIDREVGRVVMSLQFQDITRQKLDHVTEALEQMTQAFNALDGRGDGDFRASPEVPLGQIHQISRIQVAQLDAVQSDLSKAEVEIKEAVQGIHQRAATLDEECITLRNFRSISVSQDGVVQVILNTLEEVRSLTVTMLAVHDETYETIRPLESLTSNLTDVMRNLSSNIRLIALNAQIQATQIGEGTGLEVLSQRTCTISDEANAVNERAAVELDRLTAGFECMVRESRDLGEMIGAEQRWLADQGARLESRLHEYRDTTLEVFREVDNLAAQLRDRSSGLEEQLDFAADVGNELRSLRELLEHLATQSESWKPVPELSSPGTSPEIRYTMQSERDVHRAVIAGPGAVVATAVTDASAGSLDWFGDTDAATAVPVKGGATPVASTPVPAMPAVEAPTPNRVSEPVTVSSSTISEPLSPPSRAMAPAAPSPSPRPGVESPQTASAPAPNLGDNIELF
jgi:hypothetical protein